MEASKRFKVSSPYMELDLGNAQVLNSSLPLLGKKEMCICYNADVMCLFDEKKFFESFEEVKRTSFEPDRKGIAKLVLEDKNNIYTFERMKPRYIYESDADGDIRTATLFYPIKRNVSVLNKNHMKEVSVDFLPLLRRHYGTNMVKIETLSTRAEALLLGEIEKIHANRKPVYIR